MMGQNDNWLKEQLARQDLSDFELNSLRDLRQQIEGQLSSGLKGEKRFYYGGSYGKNTMISAKYDLDIVVYWDAQSPYTIESIYNSVGNVLKKHWKFVNQKKVSWELPFQGGFHIDVVPGRAIDNNYYEANLYRSDTKKTLKTSLKKHIDTIKDSGARDVVRLLKLWRTIKSVPLKKTFVLEVLAVRGMNGAPPGNLEAQLMSTFRHIRDVIETVNIADPANSNNSLTDDLDLTVRAIIKKSAQAALDAKTWGEVFS